MYQAVLFLFCFFSLTLGTQVYADKRLYADVDELQVAYFGEEDILHERLGLDEKVHLLTEQELTNLDHIDSVFLYQPSFNENFIDAIFRENKAGKLGLVINLGPDSNIEKLAQLIPSSQVTALQQSDNYSSSLSWNDGSNSYLGNQASWKSAPQILEYTSLAFEKSASTEALVTINDEQQSPLLLKIQNGKGVIYLLTPWFKRGNDAERLEYFWRVLTIPNQDAYNYPLYNWAYFNWLLNYLVYDSANMANADYATWPYSPIPHTKDKFILASIFLTLFFLSIWLFLWVRKKSHTDDNILTHIQTDDYHTLAQKRLDKIQSRLEQSSPILKPIRRLHFRAAQLFWKEIASPSEQWEEIGFIRPLAGFQMVVSWIYIGIIPIIITAIILLNYIAPFPQSVGMSTWVAGAFNLIFAIFDMGTGIAMIKYFAQYRVKNPAKAMQYVQFYIWFQLLSGIIQVTLLSFLAMSLAPETAYAFLTWMIVFKLLVQFPGFATVFHNIFRALQRYDLMILTWVLPLPFSVLIGFSAMVGFRYWGLATPAFGEVMGLTLGEMAPTFFATWIYILVSLFVYKGLGFSLKATFSAHFDKTVIKKSLSFGLRYTPGAIAPMLSGFAMPIILSQSIDNYLELTSMLMAALWINFLIRGPAYVLYSNLLASISEAFYHQKYLLSSHYVDQALKWSLMFVGGVLPYFVIAGPDVASAIMPPQWGAASNFIALAVIFGSIEFLSALPDESFKAVGKPQIFTLISLFDHSMRIVLMLFFIPHFEIYGVLYAFIISASIKCFISWSILAKWVMKLEISWWQSVVSPVLVCILIFMIAIFLKMTYQPETAIDALLWVGVFFIISPVFYFFSGLLGGFDDQSFDELIRASNMNIVSRLMAWVAIMPTKLAIRISPLHNRFPLRNWEAVQQEAGDLNKAKVKL